MRAARAKSTFLGQGQVMIEVQPASVSEVLCLPKVLDMRAARSFKSKLEEPIKAGGSWQVDASAVERVSTGCVQLLVAFFIAMKSSGANAGLVNPSKALKTAIVDLGLNEAVPSWKMES